MSISLPHCCLKVKSGLVSLLNSVITAISKSAIDIYVYGDIYTYIHLWLLYFWSLVKNEESNRGTKGYYFLCTSP